jgi:hypothetical protein
VVSRAARRSSMVTPFFRDLVATCKHLGGRFLREVEDVDVDRCWGVDRAFLVSIWTFGGGIEGRADRRE